MPFLKYRPKVTNCERLENMSKKNGLRHAIFTVPKDRYIGWWKDNEKSGKGQMLTRTFRLYEGDWERNFRHGFGVFAFRLENKVFVLEYRGDWKNGCMNGFGVRHYKDFGCYMGYFKNNKRHGYGQMWYADSSFYDGDWIRDKKHGLGLFVRVDGNRYEGTWKDDMKHGNGIFYHLDSGQMQEGVWELDYCIYSTFIDIPFRQSTVLPTYYPVQHVEVINVDEICNDTQLKALSGHIKSCLTMEISMHHSTNEEKSV